MPVIPVLERTETIPRHTTQTDRHVTIRTLPSFLLRTQGPTLPSRDATLLLARVSNDSLHLVTLRMSVVLSEVPDALSRSFPSITATSSLCSARLEDISSLVRLFCSSVAMTKIPSSPTVAIRNA